MKARSLYGWLAGTLLVVGFPAAVAAAEHAVVIEKYTFSPAELRIRKGDTVTWANNEKRVSHSVLFIGRSEESERFSPARSGRASFPKRDGSSIAVARIPRCSAW